MGCAGSRDSSDDELTDDSPPIPLKKEKTWMERDSKDSDAGSEPFDVFEEVVVEDKGTILSVVPEASKDIEMEAVPLSKGEVVNILQGNPNYILEGQVEAQTNLVEVQCSTHIEANQRDNPENPVDVVNSETIEIENVNQSDIDLSHVENVPNAEFSEGTTSTRVEVVNDLANVSPEEQVSTPTSSLAIVEQTKISYTVDHDIVVESFESKSLEKEDNISLQRKDEISLE